MGKQGICDKLHSKQSLKSFIYISPSYTLQTQKSSLFSLQTFTFKLLITNNSSLP